MPLSTRLRKLAEGIIVIQKVVTRHNRAQLPNSQIAASCEDIVDTITHPPDFRRVKRSAAVPGGCPAGVLARRLKVSTDTEALRPMLYNSPSTTSNLSPCPN